MYEVDDILENVQWELETNKLKLKTAALHQLLR